jgi:hypothetical protein
MEVTGISPGRDGRLSHLSKLGFKQKERIGITPHSHAQSAYRTAGPSTRNRMHMEALPFPLSSRAKPRDLQFYRPILEMFFEEAVWALRPVGPTAKRQPSPEGLGH